jgi:hypothetical protein
MRDQFDRLVQSQEKEYKILYEKYQKLDALFQSLVKEKNSLQSSSTLKDKEIAELFHKHEVLRTKVSSMSHSVGKSRARIHSFT